MGADASKVGTSLNDTLNKKVDRVGETLNRWKEKSGLKTKLGHYAESSSDYDSTDEDIPSGPGEKEGSLFVNFSLQRMKLINFSYRDWVIMSLIWEWEQNIII